MIVNISFIEDSELNELLKKLNERTFIAGGTHEDRKLLLSINNVPLLPVSEAFVDYSKGKGHWSKKNKIPPIIPIEMIKQASVLECFADVMQPKAESYSQLQIYTRSLVLPDYFLLICLREDGKALAKRSPFSFFNIFHVLTRINSKILVSVTDKKGLRKVIAYKDIGEVVFYFDERVDKISHRLRGISSPACLSPENAQAWFSYAFKEAKKFINAQLNIMTRYCFQSDKDIQFPVELWEETILGRYLTLMGLI